MTADTTTKAGRVICCHHCESIRSGACSLSAYDVAEHAKFNICPVGKFGIKGEIADFLKPPGTVSKNDTTAKVMEQIGNGPITATIPFQIWPNVREAHRLLMRQAVINTPPNPYLPAPDIAHVFHDLNQIAHADQFRNLAAFRTWGGNGVKLLPFMPTRTATTELNDPRDLPFIRDLFDYAAERAPIVVWSNLDAFLTRDAYAIIREHLKNHVGYYSGRLAVTDGQNPIDPRPESGIELIAMRSEWWRQIRQNVPDATIGGEGFDWCIGHLIAREWPEVRDLEPICFHESHHVYWHRHRGDPAGVYNRRITRDFAEWFGLGREIIESEEQLGLA